MADYGVEFGNREHYEANLPTHISFLLREMLSKNNERDYLFGALDVFELIMNYTTFFLIAYYIDLKEKEGVAFERDIDKTIRERIVNLSLGNSFYIQKQLLYELNKNNQLLIFEPLKALFLKKSALNLSIEKLINFRNNRAHQKYSDDEIENIDKYFKLFISHYDFLCDIMLFVPIKRDVNNQYSGLLYKGLGPMPLYHVSKQIFKNIDLESPYLLDKDERWTLNLDPFFKYKQIQEKHNTAGQLFLVHLEKDNACLVDYSSRDKITSKDTYNEFIKRLIPLSPDYKYQRRPYLRDHRICLENLNISLSLKSFDGDVNTKQELIIKKIICDSLSEEIKDDVIQFDYHDAPIYPIDDETFDLKISDSIGNAIEPFYNIHNEGMRLFSVNVGKLPFDEKKTIYLECFEPMLLNDITEKCSDYYEIDIHNPIDILEFRLTLLPKMKFVSHEIDYITYYVPIKEQIKYDKIETNGDTQELVVRISEPIVGETIKFNFTIQNEFCQNSSENNSLDSFRAGLFVHEFLKKNSNKKWEAKENGAGGITIKPV